MAKNIAAYQAAVGRAEAEFRASLANGKAGPFEVGLNRRTWEIMARELRDSPNSVLVWDLLGPDPKSGFRGPDRWYVASRNKAAVEIDPQVASPEQHERKQSEYLDLAQSVLRFGQVRREAIIDRRNG